MQEAPEVGAAGKVLPPFSEAFPGVYTVFRVVTYEDGQSACDLFDQDGSQIGAFDPKYLEPAEG